MQAFYPETHLTTQPEWGLFACLFPKTLPPPRPVPDVPVSQPGSAAGPRWAHTGNKELNCHIERKSRRPQSIQKNGDFEEKERAGCGGAGGILGN